MSTMDESLKRNRGLGGQYRRQSLDLVGMDCSDCALVIEHRLSRLEGVADVQVDYSTGRVHLAYDARRINQWAIKRRIRQLGYDLRPGKIESWVFENRELVFSLASGLALLTAWLGERYLGSPWVSSMALYSMAYFLGGYDITRHAWRAFRNRRMDTHILMLAAALGAASLGEYAEGALLLFLFSLGHALEELALGRARGAINSLADLTPKYALVKGNKGETATPVEKLELGDLVIVRPGERIPVDGQVITGRSDVDQAPVTGESMPVEKYPGEQVFAGAVNGIGALEVRVSRLAKDSTLARVMAMVEDAQESKSPTQQMVDRFTRIFVPTVLVVVIGMITTPLLFGVPFKESFSRAMTLLVATSPCALALGTPAAILASISQAARNGVLVKGGVHLENLGRIRAMAFDKTGTLTCGQPRVTDVLPLGDNSVEDVLAIAAGLEGRSGHPLAQAIVQEAEEREVALPQVKHVQAIAGLGVQGEIDNQSVLAGSPRMINQAGISLPLNARQQIEAFEKQGKSMVLIGRAEALIGLIAIADVIREKARPTLRALESLGVEHMVMLSGDNRLAAGHIAAQVGLDAYRAELMPEDKLDVIKKLISEYEVVGMVGDGINDAPALANATVGIAMGSAGNDIALETADVALMSADLSALPLAVGLGQATRRVIGQNLAISITVMLVLSVMAVGGVTGIGLAIVLHEGSTLLVVANALRLLKYSP